MVGSLVGFERTTLDFYISFFDLKRRIFSFIHIPHVLSGLYFIHIHHYGNFFNDNHTVILKSIVP